MEKWKNGKMERWKDGKMERWKDGKMERIWELRNVRLTNLVELDSRRDLEDLKAKNKKLVSFRWSTNKSGWIAKEESRVWSNKDKIWASDFVLEHS